MGIAYRDPNARYPRELQGRWFSDRRACADPRRDEPAYDAYARMVIMAETQGDRGDEEHVNAVRPLGRNAWAIDASGDAELGVETFTSATYALTRDGFALTANGHRTEWLRCQ